VVGVQSREGDGAFSDAYGFMKQNYYVVVLVVRPQRGEFELLMARRADGKYLGGTWQPISGGLEPNETAWQCALRELGEETGLKPREFYRLSTLTSFYRPDNDTLNTAPMFCALVVEDAVVTINDENTEFAWVKVDEADGRLMWPSDQQALAEVRTVILGNGPAKGYMRIPI
jgi:dihydroneopterin triphosphate diphosphatase